MSEFSKPGRRPSRENGFKENKFRKSYPSRSDERSEGSGFKGSGKRTDFSRARFGRRPKKDVKKFDPSLFMRKAEEQTATPDYAPKHTFLDFAIDAQIKTNIVERGYKSPTPIQDQAIPSILEGSDVIASANTGTGKTAAFLIPLIHNVLSKKTDRVLIIAPTRELASQIQSEFRIFAKKTNIFSALCIGGANMYDQIKDLKQDPEFVIGTPGRLIDLEQNRNMQFSKYTSIVLDEVDTMLDMGFIRDVKHIIGKLPANRHSLFFSATIPKPLKEVMDGFLNNPVTISVKTRQSAENVNQDVMKVNAEKKIDALHDLLIKPDFKKTIIFLRTKRSTDKLAKMLYERGFKISSIHGDKTQAQRKKSLSLFKDDKVKILLATDVVARGIDIDDVSHVINYDLPQSYEDYIHRIGRTGRANKIGNAITFIE